MGYQPHLATQNHNTYYVRNSCHLLLFGKYLRKRVARNLVSSLKEYSKRFTVPAAWNTLDEINLKLIRSIGLTTTIRRSHGGPLTTKIP